MEANTLAGSKKNAAKQGRIIVFIDESGLSERPTRVRTWAPRGETPVLQYHFNWHQLSVIAGITFRRFYFRLFPGAIKGPQIIEFLTALGRQIRKPLLVIWDGLPAHRSALVREYLEALKGAIQIEQLPAYAPELNWTCPPSSRSIAKRDSIAWNTFFGDRFGQIVRYHDHATGVGETREINISASGQDIGIKEPNVSANDFVRIRRC